MAKIKVPKPAKGSFNKQRPLSDLLRWQLRHMHEVEKKLPHHRRTGINVEKIKTEGAAGEYLKKITTTLHKRGKIRVPRPAAGSFQKQRLISDLLKTQIEHFHEVEMTWPADKRTNTDINSIKTEHEAGSYIAKITAILHPLVILLCIFVGLTAASAQDTAPSHETAFHAEFRLEGERFHKSCVAEFSIANCPYLLFTDHPLHIAAGSIAPQNGFGAGVALVTHYDAKSWLYKGDFDGIASANGSWRAGAYIKIIPTPQKKITVVHGTGNQPHKSNLAIFDYPLLTAYAQGISLNKIDFFGLGPATTTAGRSYFGMQQTVVGIHAIIPMPWTRKLNLAIIGEVNGRLVGIRPSTGQPSPSIETLYTNATAPGLLNQPAFVQFGEGLRLKPSLGDYLKLNYLVSFQQFVAPGDSTFSFRRFTTDLGHEIPFYRTVVVTAKDNNGPDECGTDTKNLGCPPLKSSSRNLYGAINLRFLLSESYTSAGSVVPFYFQPTLGGSDINGNSTLPSYQDYRFRAPNLMLFHAGLEHSIFSTPVGVILGADAGKVALTHGDIGFQHLRHSYSAGITLRAGGFPLLSLIFATGGHEGNHFIANLNAALLGGSSRPSLF